jgi:hypothetical protein
MPPRQRGLNTEGWMWFPTYQRKRPRSGERPGPYA